MVLACLCVIARVGLKLREKLTWPVSTDDDSDDRVAARWSPDRKWETVSVDPSGTVATKSDKDGGYGYIQTTEAVSKGVHTW